MRHSVRFAFGALCLLLGGGQLDAQQHAFRQFSTKDGLAQSQVRAMAQDELGYLWFGTLGGASRFDGRQFVNYALSDGLPDPQVSAMVRDANGTLIMGSGSALVYRAKDKLVVEHLPQTSQGARVMALVADERGNTFVGTDGGGVFLRDSAGIKPLPGYPNDTASGVRSLLLLRNGRLLIGLRNGLIVWDRGNSREIKVGSDEPKAINALAEGRDGSWWVGTVLDGLYRIDPRRQPLRKAHDTPVISTTQDDAKPMQN